jgi:predicted HicB family RNase H-like nuclease
MNEELHIITVRVPVDLHRWLTEQARADRRSLNAYIVHRFEVERAAAVADGESP